MLTVKGKGHKKAAVLLDFCPNYLPLPPPPNLDNLYNFLNAKNVDLSDIYNESLSKILLI